MAGGGRGRRSELARRFVSMACRRRGVLAEGMGVRAGLEWSPGQPRGRFGYPDCRAWCARNTLSSWEIVVEINLLRLTNPDQSDIKRRNWQRPATRSVTRPPPPNAFPGRHSRRSGGHERVTPAGLPPSFGDQDAKGGRRGAATTTSP